MSPVELAQLQFDAYNAQDIDALCACYSDDVVVADFNGDVSMQGLGAFRQRYANMFAANPQNRARLVNRIAVGNVVIDHEDVSRGPGQKPFQAIAMMTIRGDKIARVDFVRE